MQALPRPHLEELPHTPPSPERRTSRGSVVRRASSHCSARITRTCTSAASSRTEVRRPGITRISTGPFPPLWRMRWSPAQERSCWKTGDLEVVTPPRFLDDLRSRFSARESEEDVARRLASLPTSRGAKFRLSRDLKPHQHEAVAEIVARGGRALLADEPGLGKTCMAIAVAAIYRQEWPLLIICPGGLRANWRAELDHWLPAGFASVHVMRTNKDLPPRGGGKQRVCITSFDMAAALPRDERYGVVIVDESHGIKNPASLRCRAVSPLIAGAARALLLSGTPLLNRPEELYTQLAALVPSGMPSFSAFADRFCNPKPSSLPGKQLDTSGATCLPELNALLLATVLVRRSKAESGIKLPEKVRTTRRSSSTWATRSDARLFASRRRWRRRLKSAIREPYPQSFMRSLDA